MKPKIIKKEVGVTRKISETYSVTNFVTRELNENISVAVSEGKNHSEITKNIRSDRIYYVLKGKLTVKFGIEEFIAGPGDVIIVPKNTEYWFGGTFKAVLINSPAFDAKDEKIVKLG